MLKDFLFTKTLFNGGERVMDISINKLLNAESIAVIGANEKDGYSGRLLKNLINNQFNRERIYPVNPKYEQVFGLKCYPSVMSIDEPVDLAVIIVKAEYVLSVVEECVNKRVSSILIISAGFSELDKINGPQRELELKNISIKSGIRIVGPNCLGVANVKSKMWACSLSTLGIDPIPFGRAGLISHSGATGFGPLLSQAKDQQVGLKYIVTTGNEADLDVCDFIDFMLEDDEIDVVATLIEGVKDGTKLKKVTEKAKILKKPIVMLKIGESEVGERAAANHTASMTGNIEVFNALVKQQGIIKVDDYSELIEMVKTLQYKKELNGNKFAVVSHSGGIAGLVGDKLGQYGLKVPLFSEFTRTKIGNILKGFGSPSNPLDLTGQMRTNSLNEIINTVANHEQIDGFVFATHGNESFINKIIDLEKKLSFPLYFLWTGSIYDPMLNRLRNTPIPVFTSPVQLAKALKNIVNIRQTYDMPTNPIKRKFIMIEKRGKRKYLDEVESKNLIVKAGIPIPRHWVLRNQNDLKNIELDFNNQAYVMKIISNTITHKSDLGGVKLNLASKEELENAFQELSALTERNKEITGILLEEMCTEGIDLIVGVKQDQQFGPVIMLGLGGIYTEVFKLATWRLLPIHRQEIKNMIKDIRGLAKILQGYRSKHAYDYHALIDSIEIVSDLIINNKDRIESLEINPLRVLPQGQGIKALDCLIKLHD